MRISHLAFLLAIVAAAAGLDPSATRAAEQRVAVFDFELINSSLEGEVTGTRPEEIERLAMISDLLRQELEESGHYVVVDETPAAAKIEDAGYLHSCNGCEAKIARDLGAELAITGTVQKVSNLILNINLYVRDAATKKRLRAMSADIRGNTDRSWSRGVTYLVKNRLLRE